MRPALGFLVPLLAALAAPAELFAQPRVSGGPESAALTTYTVRPGDTCASIARRLFRDARRVDLIHANNDLGPAPHRLAPGRVLTVPRRATSARSPIADAVLSGVGGDVDVLSPARRRGRRNDALFRGNQVNTHDRANAEITFIDESQLHLQENTLVVILGDTSGRVQRSATARDTTLVSGGLRAYLGALAGRPNPAAAIPIQTPAGRVMVGTGEASVRVDAGRRTTLAVYQGSSRIRTRRQTVTVPQGFSVAAMPNAAPSRMRALPSTPTWRSAPPSVVFVEGAADMALQWRAGGAEAPARWHVQVARDPSFTDLAVDQSPTPNVTEMVARGMAPATWHMRVSAVDDQGVESAYSTETVVRVVQPRVVPTPQAHRSVIELPRGLFCAVDDGAMGEVTAPVAIERRSAHRLRCATSAGGADAAEMTVAAEPLGPLTVTASLQEADAAARTARVRLRVIDNSAEPLSQRELVAVASQGVAAGRVEATEEPGVYTVPVRWTESARQFSLHWSLGAEANDTEVLVLPQVPPPLARGLRPIDRLSLSLEAGGGTILSAYQQNRDAQAYEGNTRGFGAALSLGATLGYDLTDALAATASSRLWLFPSDLVPLGAANVYSAGLRLSPRLSNRTRLVVDAEAGVGLTGDLVRFTFGLGLGLDVRLTESLSLGPMLRYGHMLQPDADSLGAGPTLDEDARYWSTGLRAVLRVPR